MNVSSIMVKTTSDYIKKVIDSINLIEFCDVHFYDTAGKIIVTIEGETIHDQMEILKTIQSMPHVMSANLMYSYCEDELIRSIEHIKGISEDQIFS